MKLKVIVHEAEEGGFWAEVPDLPGCATQGETIDELVQNVREAIEGWLSIDVPVLPNVGSERIFEIVV
jgi:predicted RNase H-like HicB family nuclease